MSVLLPIHIIGGLFAIASGFIALFAWKGAKLHLKSGMVFVCAMLVLASSAVAMAILNGQPVNVVAAVLASYLVLTALFTVRRPVVGARWIDLGAMGVALTLAAACLFLFVAGGQNSVLDDESVSFAPLYLVFGAVALLAAIGDARVLLARNIKWKQRLTRHLWRMCLALFIAAGSFFLGNAQVFPEPLRSSGVLGLPVLVLVGLTFFWLARVRFTKWRPSYQ